MGQTQTRKVAILKCPEGYEPEKFKKICTLFDKLDKDSNLGVSSDEIEDIAAHHVQNCIATMQSRVVSKQQEHESTMKQVDIDEQNEIKRVHESHEYLRNKEERALAQTVQTMANKIAWYESLDKNGQADAFIKAIVPVGGEHINFWSFFEYMKTRVDDIDNLRQ